MRVAVAWSSQNPGAPMASSSSARRCARPSGSKVITDPGELGPDLLQTLVERLALEFGHPSSLDARQVGSRVREEARRGMSPLRGGAAESNAIVLLGGGRARDRRSRAPRLAGGAYSAR